MNNDKRIMLGQMIMLGLDVSNINDEIIKLIKDYKIGGVVLYKKNYHTTEEMINFINELKNINRGNIPLFIAIDQENGRVNRLPDDIERIYNVRKQALCNNEAIVDEVNEITNTLLKAVGVNMNFSPVLDVYNKNNKLIGNRSYGSLEEVIKYSHNAFNISKKHGIISVGKHFPGHGLVEQDSHIIIPSINNIPKMEQELIIYDHAHKHGMDALMIGHLKIKGYGNKPASINETIISKYLKEKCHYQGLIISDDLRMNTIKYIYGIKKAITIGINANEDILLIKYKKGDIKNIYHKLYKMLDNNKINLDKITESYNKIINIKQKYQINDNIINNKIDIAKYNVTIKNINMQIDKNNKN